jgi:hypothetical protein
VLSNERNTSRLSDFTLRLSNCTVLFHTIRIIQWCVFFQAIALDASNHLYYSNRSICFAETGKYAEAKADGEMCVKLDPTFVKGYHRKVQLCSLLGYQCHSSFAFSHSDVAFCGLQANAEFLLGELDAAVVTIREGLKKDAGMVELTKLLLEVTPTRNCFSLLTFNSSACSYLSNNVKYHKFTPSFWAIFAFALRTA